MWKTANMSLRTCVVVKQMQSNPICLSDPNDDVIAQALQEFQILAWNVGEVMRSTVPI